MATANQDQAQYEMSQIFLGDRVARNNFERASRQATFGDLGPEHYLTRVWRENQDKSMLCIQTYGTYYFLRNLRRAVLNEAVGIGPQRYCIAFNRAPTFYSKLKLLMQNLPLEKMFIYPKKDSLEGPFLRAPWLARGQRVCAKPSITFREYVANFDSENLRYLQD